MINGNWTTDPSLVKFWFFNHFRGRFTKPVLERSTFVNNDFMQIPTEMAIDLIAKFSLGEIKDEVWGCDEDKSPSPSGFNFNFLKPFWDLMAVDLLDAFRYYHAGGEISVGCNDSFMALISKVSDLNAIVDYRILA